MKLKRNLRRALLHVFTALLIISLTLIYRPVWLLFYTLIFGMILSVASLKYDIPVISWFLRVFERPRYKARFPGKGLLFLIAGCLFVIKLYPKSIALAAMAIVAIGDPLSHVISGNFKSKITKRKNILGIILSIIAAGFFASLFVPMNFAFIASACALTAEVMVIKLGEDPVDDNLLIPLVAGTVLYLLMF